MKTIMLCAASLLFAFAVMAQPPRGGMMGGGDPTARAQKMAQMMKEKLSLSDEQTTKLQAIYLDSFTKEKALMDQMKQVGEKREADVKALLTPEQAAKLDAEKQQMRQRVKEGAKDGAKRPGPAPL